MPLTPVRGGEERAHALEVDDATDVIRIEVTQRLVDCVLSVEGPGLKAPLTVNAPGEYSQPDSLTLRVAAPGVHVIRVRSLTTPKVQGKYALKVWRLPAKSLRERAAVKGELLLTEAGAKFADGSEASWRESLRLYGKAANTFASSGLTAQAARSRLSASLVAFTKLSAWDVAAREARQAIDPLLAADDLPAATLAARITASALLELAPSRASESSGVQDAGRWSECLTFFDRTFELLKRNDDPIERMLATNQRGILHFYMHEYDLARVAWVQASALARSQDFVLGELKAAENLAFLDYELGSRESAAASLDNVAALLEATGTVDRLADVLDNGAAAYSTLARPDEALRRYFRALQLHRLANDGAGEARSLHGIGMTYLHIGDTERALGFLQQALPLREAHNDPRGLVSTLLAIGTVHDQRGTPDEARAALRQAVQASHTPKERAKSLIALSRLELRAGRARPAVELADRALASGITEPHPLLAQAYLVRGKARVKLGDLAPAEGDLLRARARLAASHETILEIEALLALSTIVETRKSPVEALAVLDEAFAKIEQVRERAINPDLRARYLASQAEAFEARVELLMTLAEKARSDVERAERTLAALLSADRGRARTLRDARLRTAASASHPRHDRDGADLLDLLAAKSLQIDRLREREATDPAFLRAQEQQLRLMYAELDLLEGGQVSVGRLLEPRDVGHLQKLLPPSTSLVVYALGAKRSWAWIVQRERVAVVRLAPRASIEKLAHSYYTDESSAAHSGSGSHDSSVRLSNAVIAPVLPFLNGTRALFALDGALHYVPLASLRLAPDGLRDSPYLVERLEIGVFGSLAQLVAEDRNGTQRANEWRRELLLVADPVFSAADPRVPRTATRDAAARAEPAPVQLVSYSLPPLPGTAAEARAIVPLFAARGALTLEGFEATRDRFLAELSAGARVVHIATHAYADTREPRLSFIALSGVNERGGAINGALMTGEIASARTSAELVTLSGCDTHIGEQVFGEGLRGLSHAWIQAGARSVIGSLWRVSDDATQVLMRDFYAELEGSGRVRPSLALRDAQLAALASDRYAAPYYWAAFVPIVTTLQ